MSIRYVMHFGVCVSDLERAVRFYTEGLGFEESGRLEVCDDPTRHLLELPGADLHAVYLDREGVRIELLHYPTPGSVGSDGPRPMNQLGLTHFAIRVDSVDETCARLQGLGGKILDHTRVHNDAFDAEIVYVTDPDGTRIECVETPNDPTRPE